VINVINPLLNKVNMPIINPQELENLSVEIFKSAGASEEEAKIVSGHLVRANLAGHDSHGVIRINQYINNVKNGLTVPGAEFEIIKETPILAVIDGHWGFGQVIAKKGVELAVKKASENGISAVAIRHSNHIGRLGDYTSITLEKEMIGLIFANSGVAVAPFGGVERLLSTNPICVGIPSGRNTPFLLDMATSVHAEGKIRVRHHRNEKVPDGWLIDKEGNPTNDTYDYYEGGAILPLGGDIGYKGMGLGLLVDFLAGALTEASCSSSTEFRKPGGSNGTFIIVIDISHFTSPKEYKKRVNEVITNIKKSKKQKMVKEILIPGEPEALHKMQRMETGIDLPDTTWKSIVTIAEEYGITVNEYINTN
jgi:uncharacterized oxidoreductase